MKQIISGLWEIDEVGDSVHCYLWEWEAGATLIDTGMPGTADLLLDAIRKHGYPLHSVKRIIVTHADTDHTGGLHAARQATGAAVACHAVEKELLEHPARRHPAALWLRPPFWLFRHLPGFRVQAVTPDELWVDGDITPEGFLVIHTPGHTPGHISLLHQEKRLLITGDALANRKGKLSGPAPVFTPDLDNAMRSVWKLAKKHGDDFDVAAFGHGPPILRNAGRRVKALASQAFSTQI